MEEVGKGVEVVVVAAETVTNPLKNLVEAVEAAISCYLTLHRRPLPRAH